MPEHVRFQECDPMMIRWENFVGLEIDIALPREHRAAGLIGLKRNLHMSEVFAECNLLLVRHYRPTEQEYRICLECLGDWSKLIRAHRLRRVDPDDFRAEQIM